MRNRWLALAGSVLFAAVVSIPAAAQQSRPQQVAKLDSIANSPVVEKRVAGLAVAVVKGTDTLLLKGYGQGDLEWSSPMPADAVFEIGSVTKQFTAAAVLKLRDQGKLDLDADLTKYLPDYPLQGKRVTVRQLLNHTSGIRGYTEMPTVQDLIVRKLPRDTLVARIAAEPFMFEPGTALIYNNSAYFLLGLIIEKVSGTTYEQYVEKELFAPLGMQRSSYCTNDRVVPRRAHGFSLTPQGLVRAAYLDHTWPYSAGSLCSTAGDLVTWLRALHGGRVLPEASYRDLITPGTLLDGSPLRYAMGIARTPDPAGRPMIGHGGGINGFVTETRYYPESNLYVVVLVNTTGNLSPSALANELADVVLPRPTAPVRKAFTGDATPLAGTYSGPGRGRPMRVVVSATPEGLAFATNTAAPVPLVWVEGLTFAAGPQLITFHRSGSAPAGVVHVDGGGSHYVLKRQ